MQSRNGTSVPALVLFDIDGTLVRRSGPHHREALVEAVRRVTGHETRLEHIPVQGMLDGDILAWMLRDAGLRDADIRRHMPALMQRAQWIYSRTCPGDLTGAVCPGVIDALDTLRRRRVLTGLVTGNLARIGWKKVERAGIKRYFRFGAFADQGRSRAELVRIAIGHARRQGWIRKSTPISLIGDHPNDIDAARKNQVRSIAVATGVVARQELAQHTPDILLDTLHQLELETLLR